jgi:iron complex transport system ATP-binding protein
MTAVVATAAVDVTVRRGERTVLTNVSVSVGPGELVALVGPNGAGKSTLLSVLGGELAPTSGHAEISGRRVDAWSTPELARRRAVLPQRVTVAFPFTVAEVVRMGRAPYHRSPESADDDTIVASAMEEMAVRDLAARRHPSLSGGEQARVAVARVLAQATPILLLDEPTAALDVRFQELVLGAVARRVRAQSAAAVVVVHDLALAAAYATRVVLLSDGRIVGDGPPAEVLTAVRLTAVYEHPIAVVPHPTSGELVIQPERDHES